MITLPTAPALRPPTTDVRVSYLTGEQADCVLRERDAEWLGPASEDFAAFVAERLGVRERYGVPSTVYWWVAGEHYLGSLALRHELTPELEQIGGHIGYHVVAPWRRQGHATRMLAASLVECRRLGLDRVLLTCESTNVPSSKVMLANGAVETERFGDERRFWLDVP